jgi:transposase InsO family protein
MVVTDRLSKDVILAGMPDLQTQTVAQAFIDRVVAYHWLPDYIVSDRGAQFVSEMWSKLCELTGIQRRLSSGYHPQTDGSTERMNAVVETYLRSFCDWNQADWKHHLGMAKIAIMAREARSTKMSPFYLQHGYNVDPIQLEVQYGPENRPANGQAKLDQDKATAIVTKLRQSLELAQACMGEAQQEQERQANRHRKQPPQFKIGDRVWLRLGDHFKTKRPSRKLDWKNLKYTVLETVGPNAVRLDTPGRIHPVFHISSVRLAATDPLPSQPQDDREPLPIEIDGEDEYQVETIVGERLHRRKKQYLVKWVGYPEPTWEPKDYVADTEALDRWEEEKAARPAKYSRKRKGSQKGDERPAKKGGTVRG